MKGIYHKIFICVALTVLLAACTDDDAPVAETPKTVYPELKLSVSEMEMSAETRAAEPMSPDHEKYVKTLAVIEFDTEGLHIKGSSTYHFIDFINGTVDGKTGVGDVEKTEFGIVETTLNGLAFEPQDSGAICLVANVTEAQVLDFYDKYREPGQSYGRMTFDKFKEWALPFDYEEMPAGKDYDETVSGYIKSMYMFGYYQGKIEASDPEKKSTISIDLGRLASRLDITVVNETGETLDKRFGYHFDDMCHSAYFFPIKMSMPPTIGAGLSRTVICSGPETIDGVLETFADGASHTRYFYAAAHSAKDESEASKLHLFYGAPMREDTDEPGEGGTAIQIPLCNVSPAHAAQVPNGYSLSRNTRYHFTIRLKKKGSAAPASRSGVSYEQRQGEIMVYLP